MQKKSYSLKINNKTVSKYHNSFLKSKGAHDHPRPETKLEAEARRSIQKAHTAFSPPSPTQIRLQEIKVTFIINKLNCRARDPWCKIMRNLVFGWEWVLYLYISFPHCQVQKEQGCLESAAGIPQSEPLWAGGRAGGLSRHYSHHSWHGFCPYNSCLQIVLGLILFNGMYVTFSFFKNAQVAFRKFSYKYKCSSRNEITYKQIWE